MLSFYLFCYNIYFPFSFESFLKKSDPLSSGHGLTVCTCMRAKLLQTPWTVRFSRQKSWSGLPFPPPGDLPNPGVEPASPALAGRFFTTEAPEKPSFGSFCVTEAQNTLLHLN